jgi:hypothetical protein
LNKVLTAIAATGILLGASLSPVFADITDGGSEEEQANQTDQGSDTAKITQTSDAAESDPISDAANNFSEDVGSMTSNSTAQTEALLGNPNSLQMSMGSNSQSGGMCFNGCCVKVGCVVGAVGLPLAAQCSGPALGGDLPGSAACVKEANSDKFYDALSCTYDKNSGSGACSGMISTLPGNNNLYACSQPTGTTTTNLAWPQVGTIENL